MFLIFSEVLAYWPRQKALLCWPSAPWFLPNGWICWEVQYCSAGPCSAGWSNQGHRKVSTTVTGSYLLPPPLQDVNYLKPTPFTLSSNAIPRSGFLCLSDWSCWFSWNSHFWHFSFCLLWWHLPFRSLIPVLLQLCSCHLLLLLDSCHTRSSGADYPAGVLMCQVLKVLGLCAGIVSSAI